MNKKSGYALRIVLGGYLAYLGVRILTEMIQKRPSNMTFMSVMAVIFIVVGIGYAGNAICKAFNVDIKKLLIKMQAKKKASEEVKPEANHAENVTEEKTVSADTLPTMLSEDEKKKLEEAVSEKTTPEQEIKVEDPVTEEKEADAEDPVIGKPEETAEEEITENKEAENKENTEDATEKKIEQKDTKVVDFSAEMNEIPISEDAENDFEEK